MLDCSARSMSPPRCSEQPREVPLADRAWEMREGSCAKIPVQSQSVQVKDFWELHHDDDSTRKRNSELLRFGKCGSAGQSRANAEPWPISRHRADADSARRPGLRARSGAKLCAASARLQSALSFRTGDRGRLQCLRGPAWIYPGRRSKIRRRNSADSEAQ